MQRENCLFRTSAWKLDVVWYVQTGSGLRSVSGGSAHQVSAGFRSGLVAGTKMNARRHRNLVVDSCGRKSCGKLKKMAKERCWRRIRRSIMKPFGNGGREYLIVMSRLIDYSRVYTRRRVNRSLMTQLYSLYGDQIHFRCVLRFDRSTADKVRGVHSWRKRLINGSVKKRQGPVSVSFAVVLLCVWIRVKLAKSHLISFVMKAAKLNLQNFDAPVQINNFRSFRVTNFGIISLNSRELTFTSINRRKLG